MINLFLIYQFLKRLATPFNKWDAYKEGIIDKNGKVLKKKKNFTKSSEKASWKHFDILVANLKKLLAKVPGGKTKFATYAAALLLLKETKNKNHEILNEIYQESYLEIALMEEIANVVANHAAVKPGDEPPKFNRKRKRVLDMWRRQSLKFGKIKK